MYGGKLKKRGSCKRMKPTQSGTDRERLAAMMRGFSTLRIGTENK